MLVGLVNSIISTENEHSTEAFSTKSFICSQDRQLFNHYLLGALGDARDDRRMMMISWQPANS